MHQLWDVRRTRGQAISECPFPHGEPGPAVTVDFCAAGGPLHAVRQNAGGLLIEPEQA